MFSIMFKCVHDKCMMQCAAHSSSLSLFLISWYPDDGIVGFADRVALYTPRCEHSVHSPKQQTAKWLSEMRSRAERGGYCICFQRVRNTTWFCFWLNAFVAVCRWHFFRGFMAIRCNRRRTTRFGLEFREHSFLFRTFMCFLFRWRALAQQTTRITMFKYSKLKLKQKI